MASDTPGKTRVVSHLLRNLGMLSLIVVWSMMAFPHTSSATAKSKAKTIHVNQINARFTPSLIDARAGDTLVLCNKGQTISAPFSYSRFNKFGSSPKIRLHPGQCKQITLHNSTATPILISVHDEFHSHTQLHLILLPREWKGPAPPYSSFLPAEPKPSAGAFPGGTATELTLELNGSKAVTDLRKEEAGTVEITSVNTATLSGKASLNGTLPPGWTLVVWYPTPETILVNSPTGGEIKGITAEPPGLVARNGIGAYICSSPVPPVCDPTRQANVFITWTAPQS